MIREDNEKKALECIVLLIQKGSLMLRTQVDWGHLFRFFDDLERLQSMLWSDLDEDQNFRNSLLEFCSKFGCMEIVDHYIENCSLLDLANSGSTFQKSKKRRGYRSLHFLFIKGRIIAFEASDITMMKLILDYLSRLHSLMILDQDITIFELELQEAAKQLNMPAIEKLYFGEIW